MQFVVGVILFVVSVAAFLHALPKGGQVRGYLRNDAVQSYYAVALVGGIVGGLLLAALGVASWLN